MGFQDLPPLPRKRVFMNERDTDERQRGLDLYLKELTNRKDTRNSQPVVEFLNLHEFCPEILYNVPQLLIKKEFPRLFVSCCLFLEAHNLYIIALTCKTTKQSRFEIYSFRQTGLIQDQYRIKNTEAGGQGPRDSEIQADMGGSSARHSVVEILNSPINISRKNTFFSSIPETKDLKNTAEIRL